MCMLKMDRVNPVFPDFAISTFHILDNKIIIPEYLIFLTFHDNI